MILTGVLVNVAAIAACAFIGTYVVRGVPERFNEIVSKGLGLSLIHISPLILCTDNGVMIGCAAYYEFMNGKSCADLTLDAYPSMPLGV